jgi:hypothetical protein
MPYRLAHIVKRDTEHEAIWLVAFPHNIPTHLATQAATPQGLKVPLFGGSI